MREEGTALMLEGGKHTIPKSVPLTESLSAGVIQQPDQEVHPFFAHGLERFSLMHKTVLAFLGEAEGPVPIDLPCCLFY